MRPYEVMVIFDIRAEPPAIQAVVDRLTETIRAQEGTPGRIDRWGRRPFAYEVQHRSEGYYIVVELTGTPRTVEQVSRLLTLADEVLRYKVVRLPEKASRRPSRPSRSGTRPRAAERPDVGAAPATGSSFADAPAEPAPTDAMPADDAPAEPAPTDAMPADDAPAESAPVDPTADPAPEELETADPATPGAPAS